MSKLEFMVKIKYRCSSTMMIFIYQKLLRSAGGRYIYVYLCIIYVYASAFSGRVYSNVSAWFQQVKRVIKS